MVSGESDFLLHCVASDLGTFQSFVIEELTSTPNVDTVRTALTIRQVKDEGLVAFSDLKSECMSPKSAQRFWDNDMHQNKDLKRVA